MNECDECGAAVDPRWKFCLGCGQRMSATAGDVTPVRTARLHFDWQLTLGVVLALTGIAMVVYLVMVLIIPQG